MAGVFTRLRAYSFRHPHFPSLQGKASAAPSPLRERSPTPERRQAGVQAIASVDGLTVPTILGATSLDW